MSPKTRTLESEAKAEEKAKIETRNRLCVEMREIMENVRWGTGHLNEENAARAHEIIDELAQL